MTGKRNYYTFHLNSFSFLEVQLFHTKIFNIYFFNTLNFYKYSGFYKTAQKIFYSLLNWIKNSSTTLNLKLILD